MVTMDRVEAVIQKIRPFLQVDGGDIEVLGVEANAARVRLAGACASCPNAHVMTLYLGVERALREEMPEFAGLRVVASPILFKDAGVTMPSARPVTTASAVTPISLDQKLLELERSLIAWALTVSRGNKSRAAALLQMKRSTLGDRIRHCGLASSDFSRRTGGAEAAIPA